MAHLEGDAEALADVSGAGEKAGAGVAGAAEDGEAVAVDDLGGADEEATGGVGLMGDQVQTPMDANVLIFFT